MKVEGTLFTNSRTCSGVAFNVRGSGHDLSLITISGRYPESGTAMNKESHEMVYVTDGEGRVEIEGKSQALKVGDVVSIPPNNRFFWDGNMKLVMSCQPAFRPEQYVLEQDEKLR